MIVEFYGIPGSGKTYCADIYKRQLAQDEVPYIDLSRCSKTPLWLKILYKIVDKCIYFVPRYYKINRKLRSLCRQAKPKYLPFSLHYCVNRIVCSIFLQDFFGKRKKIAINDEGLFQWIAFLSVQYGVAVDSVKTILPPVNVNCKNVYVQKSIENAFANIKQRNRHVCPMDEMPDDDLKNYLVDYNNALELLKNKGCDE